MFSFGNSLTHQRSRRRTLRLETFESRIVPAVGVGVNIPATSSNAIPPIGNSGAVGPNHFVQFTIGVITVYDKDGAFQQQKADSQFWMDAGISLADVAAGLSQPRILYDEISARWLAIELNLASTGNKVLIGRSDTSDPTGTWKALSFAPTSLFANFPTLALDGNGVYIGTGNFTSSSGSPVGSSMTSIPKADLLLATPTLANRTTVVQAVPPFGTGVPMGWSPQAVSNSNASDTSATVIATHYTSFNLLTHWEITNSGGTPPATFGTPANLSIPHNALPGSSRQPDGTRQISSGEDDRYTGAIVQVGDLIYAAHSISVNASGVGTTSSGSTTNAVQLFVIRDSTNAIVANATYFNPSYDYIFPSVAANVYGDIVIGLNRSGGVGSVNGNLGAFAVHARVNPANPTAITFLDEIELKAGLVSNYHQVGGALETWGPYSATSADPNNAIEFWSTLQFAQSDAQWGTQISQIYVSPRVLEVNSPTANGTYGVGSNVAITVQFNGNVAVTGTPQLSLNSGGVANYTSGSGTDTLTFTYTVGAGQSSGDLDYDSVNALSLNGGSIKVASANVNVDVAAELALPTPGTAGSLGANKAIVIDGVIPGVTGVTSPAVDGTYGFNTLIPITITFNRDVVVSGTPLLALNSGGTASYFSGSASNTLVFHYTVGANQSSADLDYSSAGALTLNGGSIIDELNSAPANLALPAPGAAGSLGANKNLVINAISAAVTNVTSPTANGAYAIGSVIDVTVQFNRPVNVSGTPRLALNSGATVNYLSGSGTNTLLFQYTVGNGEASADLDYVSTGALTLNGGTIQEGNGLPANLNLPAPGAANSLGFNKSIVVDGVGPTVVEYRVLFGTRRYNLIGSTRFDLPWLVKGIQVVFDEPVMTGAKQSLTGITATSFSGKKTKTLTWRFAGIAKGSFNTGLADSGLNALRDAAGNPITAFGQAFQVLYGDFDDNGVVDALDEAGVRANIAKPYQLNSANYNIFADLSGDGIVNLIDVGISKTRKGQSLP